MFWLFALVAYCAFPFFVTLPHEGMNHEQRDVRSRKMIVLWIVGLLILLSLAGVSLDTGYTSQTRYG